MHSSDSGRCICAQVRCLARQLSAHYDSLLSPEELTITQYSLLHNIHRIGPVAHAALAKQLGMERTTLTRNLRPLLDAKLVITALGEDRRRHLLEITPAGTQKLLRSFPLWEKAQYQFLAQLGSETMLQLRKVLQAAETAATKTLNDNRHPSLSERYGRRSGSSQPDTKS